MAQLSLASPRVTVNNITVAIKPNSFTYTEGFGEQTMRVQSGGGGSLETVFSDNLEMKLSDVKWTMENTAENIELVRTWKLLQNSNAITVTDPNSGFNRTFIEAALTNNYEVQLGSDTEISVEFMSRGSV